MTTECPTCRTNGRAGYCAPKRCYCGHPECPAYPHDPPWTRGRRPMPTNRRPMPADRCPICNAQNGEPFRNSINNKPRDRRHATRPVVKP